jgi:hypothetical protein
VIACPDREFDGRILDNNHGFFLRAHFPHPTFTASGVDLIFTIRPEPLFTNVCGIRARSRMRPCL